MMLIGWASCSPSLWTGQNDSALPFAAQGSPHAVGTSMTPAAGTTYTPAHGQYYGAYCHSDISNGNSANHTSAVNAATNKIVNWLFTSAPRVTGSGKLTTPVMNYGQTTGTYSTGGSCPSGWANGPAITVVGSCSHPGYFDGNDHPVSDHPTELTATTGSACSGTFKWKQNHDSSNGHAATFWYKSYTQPAGGGLVSTFVAN
jgi:hypothetical protein